MTRVMRRTLKRIEKARSVPIDRNVLIEASRTVDKTFRKHDPLYRLDTTVLANILNVTSFDVQRWWDKERAPIEHATVIKRLAGEGGHVVLKMILALKKDRATPKQKS